MKFKLVEKLLTEVNSGGQATYKLFLQFLLGAIGVDIDDIDAYHLHHINGKHEDNAPDNIALMLAHDHRSLHGRIKGKSTPDYSERLINEFNKNFRDNDACVCIGKYIDEMIAVFIAGLDNEADRDDRKVEEN